MINEELKKKLIKAYTSKLKKKERSFCKIASKVLIAISILLAAGAIFNFVYNEFDYLVLLAGLLFALLAFSVSITVLIIGKILEKDVKMRTVDYSSRTNERWEIKDGCMLLKYTQSGKNMLEKYDLHLMDSFKCENQIITFTGNTENAEGKYEFIILDYYTDSLWDGIRKELNI